MSTRWLVCGAGKGVGKTRLALGLAAALPGAVYAKHGHGPPRPEKPRPFFADVEEARRFLETQAGPVVMESNALALEGAGDVVVYVDGAPAAGARRGDAEALRARAHLVVAPEVAPERWDPVLERVLADPEVRRRVAAALDAQRRHGVLARLVPGTKVWLAGSGGRGFGAGLVALLDAVNDTGTLRAAARQAGISYRHAWDLVRDAEAVLGVTLLRARPGGPRGGRSEVTPEGRRLAAVFRTVEGELRAYADRRVRELLAEDTDGSI